MVAHCQLSPNPSTTLTRNKRNEKNKEKAPGPAEQARATKARSKNVLAVKPPPAYDKVEPVTVQAEPAASSHWDGV